MSPMSHLSVWYDTYELALTDGAIVPADQSPIIIDFVFRLNIWPARETSPSTEAGAHSWSAASVLGEFSLAFQLVPHNIPSQVPNPNDT